MRFLDAIVIREDGAVELWGVVPLTVPGPNRTESREAARNSVHRDYYTLVVESAP